MDLKKSGCPYLLMAIFILFLGTAETKGQSRLFVNASQQITNFRFAGSEGVMDRDYQPVYNGAYSFGYAYEFDFGLFLRASTGMRKAGATLVYDAANYEWDLQYLNTVIGAGYQLELGTFAPYIAISGYYGYLLKAHQRVNNEDFDIIDSQALIRHDAGIILSPGVNINISETFRIFAELSFSRGLQNVEAESEAKTTLKYLLSTRELIEGVSDQVSTNIAIMFTVGLSFALD